MAKDKGESDGKRDAKSQWDGAKDKGGSGKYGDPGKDRGKHDGGDKK